MNQDFGLDAAVGAMSVPDGGDPATDLAPPGSLAPDSRLFDLGQLDVRWDRAAESLWTWMTPVDRPNFNPAMLRDFQRWQAAIKRVFGAPGASIKYLVLGSRFPGIFNLGGDLDLFAGYIARRDRDGLVGYGRDCVSILHENMRALDLPLVTIGLVQGDALGGGFEAVLSFNVIVAERNARFGLPEIAFGLFPGMGAHALLARKLGVAKAEQMMLSNRLYSAEEMHELGLVHILADPGCGEEAVRAYIARNGRKQGGHHGIYQASGRVAPITLAELEAVVEIWADAALCLSPGDLKLMKRLVDAQSRLAG
jgi:DSF synthase